MEEHLRLAVCYWHTFCWEGNDMFGGGSLNRSWQKVSNPLEAAKQKAEIAFEFLQKLGVPKLNRNSHSFKNKGKFFG